MAAQQSFLPIKPDAVVAALPPDQPRCGIEQQLSKEALQLHQTLFNPDRLQAIFVGEIEKLAAAHASQ